MVCLPSRRGCSQLAQVCCCHLPSVYHLSCRASPPPPPSVSLSNQRLIYLHCVQRDLTGVFHGNHIPSRSPVTADSHIFSDMQIEFCECKRYDSPRMRQTKSTNGATVATRLTSAFDSFFFFFFNESVTSPMCRCLVTNFLNTDQRCS